MAFGSTWLDERLDPEKSTIAAARHLRDLYAIFGSWTLAQAAYNAGEMRVSQAIRRWDPAISGRSGGDRSSRMRPRIYIPAIQAATLIAREPERYGFVFTPAEPLAYEVVIGAARDEPQAPGRSVGHSHRRVRAAQSPSSSSSRLHLTAPIRSRCRSAWPSWSGRPSSATRPAMPTPSLRVPTSSRQGNPAGDGARRQAPRDRGRDREALRRLRG